MEAKQYIEENYGAGHLKTVIELNDVTSLEALMDEFAEWKSKNCNIYDVTNSALNEIRDICNNTNELNLNFTTQEARDCDNALSEILIICDEALP